MSKETKQSKKKAIEEVLRLGWVPNWVLVRDFGPSALRRVRELNINGAVRKRRVLKDAKWTFTWEYRIY